MYQGHFHGGGISGESKEYFTGYVYCDHKPAVVFVVGGGKGSWSPGVGGDVAGVGGKEEVAAPKLRILACKKADVGGDTDLVLNCTGNSISWNRSTIPDRWTAVNKLIGLSMPEEIVLDWDDGKEPPVEFGFWKVFLDEARRLKVKKITVCCLGSHGRTGTALTAMLISGGMAAAEAIEFVRKEHCKKAIESVSQIDYLYLMDKAINGRPLPDVKKGGSKAAPSGFVATCSSGPSCPHCCRNLIAKELGLGVCEDCQGEGLKKTDKPTAPKWRKGKSGGMGGQIVDDTSGVQIKVTEITKAGKVIQWKTWHEVDDCFRCKETRHDMVEEYLPAPGKEGEGVVLTLFTYCAECLKDLGKKLCMVCGGLLRNEGEDLGLCISCKTGFCDEGEVIEETATCDWCTADGKLTETGTGYSLCGDCIEDHDMAASWDDEQVVTSKPAKNGRRKGEKKQEEASGGIEITGQGV